MRERLSTGVDVLDRELGGGVPAGTVVAYEAPPASQGELPLYELTLRVEEHNDEVETPSYQVVRFYTVIKVGRAAGTGSRR